MRHDARFAVPLACFCLSSLVNRSIKKRINGLTRGNSRWNKVDLDFLGAKALNNRRKLIPLLQYTEPVVHLLFFADKSLCH